MNASNRKLYVYQYPDGGTGGTGTGGGGNGTGTGTGTGTGAAAAFADATAARTYLKDYVNDEGVLSAVADDKVVPWATHVKSKFDQLGTQFPGNWRDQIAGEDKTHLKTLETFASPKALYNSYAALRGKLTSGELKAVVPFPAAGTDADKAAWRAENGVPAKPEDYKFELSKGGKLGEKDEALVSEYRKAAFATNMRPDHFQASLNFMFAERVRQKEAMVEADTEFRLTSEDELRAEWGQGYRENVNRIAAFLDGAPQGVKDIVVGARGPDGKPLGSHPAVLRWLADLARQTNPAGVLLPGAGGNISKSVQDEIEAIEKVMKTNRSAYNKDEKAQARLRELYTARDQLKSRQKAA